MNPLKEINEGEYREDFRFSPSPLAISAELITPAGEQVSKQYCLAIVARGRPEKALAQLNSLSNA